MSMVAGFAPAFGAGPPSKLTVLYDNYSLVEGAQADWGFACLIEGMEKTVLFDAGTKPEVLKHNVETLNFSLEQVQQIVISHAHGDHTGGLKYVMDQVKDVEIFVPNSFPDVGAQALSRRGAVVTRVLQPREISPKVHLTGEMGEQIKEQSLLLDTPDGLYVITGRSHQGTEAIVKRSREIIDKQISLIFGGFHLNRHSEAQIVDIIAFLSRAGVRRCGPTHCTGDKAILMFKEAYGDDFVPMGVGKIIEIP
jgi:7,8-dihydropterin-6-yl-methyl-4-(beta-D-ribofuranosyl)aminobenzene 5'-phosphate synthase